jgi:succinoglycan biosynthesis protein ExoV
MKLYRHKTFDQVKNFGDDLNLWLWDRIMPGVLDNDPETIFVGIGTLLNEGPAVYKRKVVFGSGVGYGPLPRIDDSWKIYCLRGPLSARALGQPENLAITDGAMLLRSVVSRQGVRKIWKFSYMPHVTSAFDGEHSWKVICENLGFGYIDPRWPIPKVIEAIQSTECLMTEAMHGAIVAEAVRVPWIAVKTRDEILSFKWHDWCASLKLSYHCETLPTLWPSEMRGNWVVSLKNRWKRDFLGSKLRRIARSVRPTSSQESVLNQAVERLQGKLDEFRSDFQSGLFGNEFVKQNKIYQEENEKWNLTVKQS